MIFYCNEADKNATLYAIPPAIDPNVMISNKELNTNTSEIYDLNSDTKTRQATKDKIDDPSSNRDDKEYAIRGIIPNNIKLIKHENP